MCCYSCLILSGPACAIYYDELKINIYIAANWIEESLLLRDVCDWVLRSSDVTESTQQCELN